LQKSQRSENFSTVKRQRNLCNGGSSCKENGIAWSSTAPPSLGEMNIFGNEIASEKDPNDAMQQASQYCGKEYCG
jgi:hypothetical protein